MTGAAARSPGAPVGVGSTFDDLEGDSYARRAGRAFIQLFYGALRAVRLYPVENAAVQKALEELTAHSAEVLRRDNEFEFRLAGEFLFVNGTRLRLDLDNYASFSQLLSLLRSSGVGEMSLAAPATARDWLVFLSLLQSPAGEGPAARLAQLTERLGQAQVAAFRIGPPVDAPEDGDERAQAREAAKRTYTDSIAVTKDVMRSVRMGKSPSVKRVKRAVQGIVDQILTEETSLLGLTTIRDYDEYTFTHSVNVCIFSIALGRRLGLTKLQLYDLGLAALLHDIGKSRVPIDVLQSSHKLSEDEWRMIAAHPWLGVLTLFQMRGQQELPYRPMVVAYEHHMKRDMTGYPRPVRPRAMSIYSKIVAVADGFDAATSRRSYQAVPLTPAAVLQEMRDNANRGMDPVVVKAFINLTGIYPVGTLVVLDTFELAIVHAANPSAEAMSRPIVRIVGDDRGQLLHPGHLVDLTEQGEGGVFLRSIIKTANPDQYGIRVGDYFV